jgi:hypothetical protein
MTESGAESNGARLVNFRDKFTKHLLLLARPLENRARRLQRRVLIQLPRSRYHYSSACGKRLFALANGISKVARPAPPH